MTLDELKQWMKDRKIVDHGGSYDDRSNFESYRIYEDNGQLYKVNFCNGYPDEAWGEKGYIRGVYHPKKVVKKTRIIEKVYYEEV